MAGSAAVAPEGSKAGDANNSKFEKGGATDISNGPLKARKCTDLFCLVVWVLSLGVFIIVTCVGAASGDPWKLVRERDYRGDYCGVEKQWNNGRNLKDFALQTLYMNVSATVDAIAAQLVCSSSAEDVLSDLLDPTALEKYRCACCLSACKSCMGSATVVDLTNPTEISSIISGRMGELTSSQKAGDLFSPGSLNGDMFSNMWAEATKYLRFACAADCKIELKNTTRNYTYLPSPDTPWGSSWDLLLKSSTSQVKLANRPSLVAIQRAMQANFTFPALSESDCPYPARDCVPFPGLVFVETQFACIPQLNPLIMGVGSTASSTLQSALKAASGQQRDFGDLVGDFLVTIDVLVLTCVFSLVIGLIFLILLRFVVGCVVWCSLYLVVVAFSVGGGLMYVKSGQCAGVSITNTGAGITTSVANAALAAATLTQQRSELYSDPAARDYRGGQTRTISNRLCQAWSKQSPHNHSVTPSLFPNDGLEENLCRNPGGNATTIWCYTMDPQKRWELCAPITIGRTTCPAGYEITSERARRALEIAAYVAWAAAGVWVLLVLCLVSRIRLAIAVNKVAAMFIIESPAVVLIPLVQIILGCAWCILWALSITFLLSQVPNGYTPTESYATYAEAYGTDTVPGKCTNKWPAAFVWKSEGDLTKADDLCSGHYGDTSKLVDGPKCWMCYPPRYILDARFWISLFCYLWNNALLIAFGQCTIACAVGMWFFTPADQKKQSRGSVLRAVKTIGRYHIGSLAFGAFILALVQWLRYLMKWLEMQAKAQKNKIVVLILKVVQCCLWCFEKCIAFLNKNAYIQIALVGTSFCKSAKVAFFLIARNIIRFGTVAMLGSVINVLGVAFITVATTLIGYVVLVAIHPDSSPIVPIILYILVGYTASRLYMNVFGLSVDTALQCFIIVEEMGREEDLSFVPGPLKALCPKH